mmetsp:Transcript_53168/g.124550  ORF Transcript_53168/g.124550 Transcript_53168/m.124550 type:complete len:247 (+) Transcript_53168:598-1338(+)
MHFSSAGILVYRRLGLMQNWKGTSPGVFSDSTSRILVGLKSRPRKTSFDPLSAMNCSHSCMTTKIAAIPCGSIIMVMSCRTMKFHTLCGTTLAGLLLPWPSSSCTCLAISSRFYLRSLHSLAYLCPFPLRTGFIASTRDQSVCLHSISCHSSLSWVWAQMMCSCCTTCGATPASMLWMVLMTCTGEGCGTCTERLAWQYLRPLQQLLHRFLRTLSAPSARFATLVSLWASASPRIGWQSQLCFRWC